MLRGRGPRRGRKRESGAATGYSDEGWGLDECPIAVGVAGGPGPTTRKRPRPSRRFAGGTSFSVTRQGGGPPPSRSAPAVGSKPPGRRKKHRGRGLRGLPPRRRLHELAEREERRAWARPSPHSMSAVARQGDVWLRGISRKDASGTRAAVDAMFLRLVGRVCHPRFRGGVGGSGAMNSLPSNHQRNGVDDDREVKRSMPTHLV